MEEVALPVAAEPTASIPVETPDAQAQTEQTDTPAEAKPEKTPEQRELDRARRKIDRLVRQREELRAQVLTPKAIAPDNRQDDGDSAPLTLSRAELQEYVKAEAAKLAPTLKEQQTAIEHRQGVVQSLSKAWGQEKFDAVASDLDEALGGLTDRDGKPKPATDAIFEADNPQALIEYLADPENADEAEAIGRMSASQAGRALTKLETRIEAEKAKAKPQPSKAAEPLEPVKGSGTAPTSPSDTDSMAEWVRKERARMATNRGK